MIDIRRRPLPCIALHVCMDRYTTSTLVRVDDSTGPIRYKQSHSVFNGLVSLKACP